KTAHGKPFVDISKQQQKELVKQFHDEAVAAELAYEVKPDDFRRPFITTTKELTLLGFFSSKPGATEVLQYVAVPGSFQACIPISQAGNGKSGGMEQSRRF